MRPAEERQNSNTVSAKISEGFDTMSASKKCDSFRGSAALSSGSIKELRQLGSKISAIAFLPPLAGVALALKIGGQNGHLFQFKYS